MVVSPVRALAAQDATTGPTCTLRESECPFLYHHTSLGRNRLYATKRGQLPPIAMAAAACQRSPPVKSDGEQQSPQVVVEVAEAVPDPLAILPASASAADRGLV